MMRGPDFPTVASVSIFTALEDLQAGSPSHRYSIIIDPKDGGFAARISDREPRDRNVGPLAPEGTYLGGTRTEAKDAAVGAIKAFHDGAYETTETVAGWVSN